MLAEGLRHSAEVQTADTMPVFKTRLSDMQPDIVHCHGCWQRNLTKAISMSRRRGIRTVLSPHGQLEPWIIKKNFLQRRAVEQAYALIAFGKMEKQYLSKLEWNPRIEVIHNAVTTNSIKPEEMCSLTFAVYQKVLDSNVLEQMTDDDKRLLAIIIKAGITGDAQWIDKDELKEVSSSPDWRRILIYASHQNISNYVNYGINILGLPSDDIDTSRLSTYFPSKYQRPRPLKELIGDFKGDETDYLIRMLRQLQNAPLLLHLIELHRELLRDSVDDDSLSEALEEKHLTIYAARTMQILHEQTLLDEGYMPLSPLSDRGTKHLRNLITNHLKI